MSEILDESQFGNPDVDRIPDAIEDEPPVLSTIKVDDHTPREKKRPSDADLRFVLSGVVDFIGWVPIASAAQRRYAEQLLKDCEGLLANIP